MFVVAEHVEAGARRRQQHGVAGLRQGMGAAHGIIHVACAFDRHLRSDDGLFDQRPVAPDQHHGARMLRHGFAEWRKVLSLAVAAGDENDLAIVLSADAVQSRYRGSNIGALGIVVPGHAIQFCHFLHPMRQAAETAQGGQQCIRIEAEAHAQGQRRHRVGGIVQAGQRQFGDRQQKAFALHDPRFAPIHAQAEILVGCGCVEAEADDVTIGQRHPAHPPIAAIEHLHARRALGTLKNSRLGRCVLVEIDVAIEMVVGDVEDGRRRRIQRPGGLQLKTGKLQHPDLRQRIGILRIHQGRQGRRRNIAGNADGLARGAQQMAGQRGGGGLAVGAGDGQHRNIPAQTAQRLGKQFDLADHRNSGGTGVDHHHQPARKSG